MRFLAGILLRSTAALAVILLLMTLAFCFGGAH
jgi:hypothetical protein